MMMEFVTKHTGLHIVAAVLIAAVAIAFVGIGAANATIHPIVSSECAKQQSGTGAGESQDPPGQTPGATPGEGALAALEALLANGALVIEDDNGTPDPTDDTFGGPAHNGDSGDEHCTNPEHNTHPDE